MIRVAVGQFQELDEADLRFAAQLGACGVTFNHPDFQLPSWRKLLGSHGPYKPAGAKPPGSWGYMDLVRLRTLIESHGLKLEVLENVPGHFVNEIHQGGPNVDEQIANYCQTIENMGRAGIKMLGYTWNVTRVWRTSQYARIRGGARTTEFDYDIAKDAPLLLGRRYEADEVWKNYERFITAVLPVAEKYGVRMALHPDDPPVKELGGVTRIMNSIEGLERAMQIGDSPNHGLDFCMGTLSEGGVPMMCDALERFAARGKVFYCHVRNIHREGERFHETFIDQGDMDVPHALGILLKHGFDGFIIDDHVPKLSEDTAYGHRARAHAMGYLQGVVRCVQGKQA